MTEISVRHDEDGEERRRLGERLREVRTYLGLKQAEVAAHLRISRTALSDIENGKRRIEATELSRLARLYRHPVTYFTGEDTTTAVPIDVTQLVPDAAQLSPEDRDELRRFAEYLHARSRAASD